MAKHGLFKGHKIKNLVTVIQLTATRKTNISTARTVKNKDFFDRDSELFSTPQYPSALERVQLVEVVIMLTGGYISLITKPIQSHRFWDFTSVVSPTFALAKRTPIYCSNFFPPLYIWDPGES